MDNNDIIVEYSGWAKTSAWRVNFQYVGTDVSKDGIISGVVWKLLSEDETDPTFKEVVI